MRRNVGQRDRYIRVALGVVIIALGLIFGSWWGLLGLIPLVTGLAGYCGLYRLLNISSFKERRSLKQRVRTR